MLQVAICDDDRAALERYAAQLERLAVQEQLGIRLTTFPSGEALLFALEDLDWRLDILYLDVQMPGLDGIETARQLRKTIGEEVPILLISAYDWSGVEEEARQAGISGFIAKPLFKSTLYYGLSRFAASGDGTAEPSAEAMPDYTGRRLLLAEDNDLNWEIANELLSAHGFVLDWAENGQICVDKFRAAQPGFYDAVLMDLRMPVMNGYEAAKAIRASGRADADIPIIAMTADAFSEDIQKCLECGMNAHVSKPIDIRELLRLLQKYLG